MVVAQTDSKLVRHNTAMHVNKAKEERVSKTILFNLCGHGFVDMTAYQDYFDGKLRDHSFTDEELTAELASLALKP